MFKKILIIIAIILGLFICATVVVYFTVVRPTFKQAETVRQMEIADIDLKLVRDGVYEGDFTYGKFTCQVSVSVKGHRIENIKILNNRDTKYAKLAEDVIEKILISQTPKVDAVTGATTTSKALAKAVENALNKGIQK